MAHQLSNRLADLASRFWQFYCRELPLFAVLAGEPVEDAALFRESLRDHERRHRLAGQLLDEIDVVRAAVPTPDDLVAEAILRHELSGFHRLYDVQTHLRPTLFPNGPVMMLVHFANMAGITDEESAEQYVDRLATAPDYFRDLEQCLLEGKAQGFRYTRCVLACAVAQARGTLAVPFESLPWIRPFCRPGGDSHPRFEAAAARARRVIHDDLLPAIERYVALLQGPLDSVARETVGAADAPGGENYYREHVRQFATTDQTPDAIHETGLSETERLEAEVDEVAAAAGFPGASAEYRRFLAGGSFVAPSAHALLNQIASLAKRIDGQIPRFFGRIPRMTYTVALMPEAVAEHMPPAYAQPNPVDRRAAGIHWVTSLPARLPAYQHPSVVLHEAWPGHLMHIALIQEDRHLPPFRRHAAVRYPACIEGWALYCESLGTEMGAYATLHERYGRLESELWRAVRLVVDTGIHSRGWTRDRAIDYMAQHLTLSRDVITTEVDRYIAWPGQALVYQLGNLAFRRVRARAEATLGHRFDIRAFHDAILAAGPVTLPALDHLMDRWLEGQGPREPHRDTHDKP